MATHLDYEAEIAAINARLRDFEARLPIPASIAAIIPDKPRYTGLRASLFVMPYNGGVACIGGRKPCWSMKMASFEAEKLAKMLGRLVFFVPWNKEISDVMIPKDHAGMGWQEVDKLEQGHDAVLIVEELQAMWRGGYERVKEWIFAGEIPPGMVAAKGDVDAARAVKQPDDEQAKSRPASRVIDAQYHPAKEAF